MSLRRRSVRWPIVLLVAGSLLVVVAAGLWRTRPNDPFAQLEEHDEAHDNEANSAVQFPPGVAPADQLRAIEDRLRVDPKNLALLSQKIHLGLEYAPQVAVEECRRILQQTPENYFALHHAAMAYLAITNLDRAMYYAAKALQVRDTPEAHFVAGHIFYAKGDFTGALNHYRTVLKMNPRDEAARGFVEKTERALATRR